MAPKGKKGKAKGLSVNFEGVKAFKLPKEGEYVAEVKEVSEETSSNSGQPYLSWVLETAGGATLYYNTSLQPKALWNLRGFLEAMGEEVPDGEMDLDLESYVGNKVGVVIEHETYENKKRARIVDVMPAEEVEGGEEEEEEVKGKGKKNKAKEKPDADDVMTMDEDDLQATIEEFDLDVDLDDHKKLSAKRNAVRMALHGDEDEEEEDEEDAGSKKGGKKSKGKADEDEDEEDESDDEGGGEEDDDEGVEITEELIDGMTAKQLEEFIEEQELEVELSGNIKKDRRRVIKACKEKGLIEEEEEEE